MAWRRLGDKPLSDPLMVSLTTHICVTRPQLNYSTRFSLQRTRFSHMTSNQVIKKVHAVSWINHTDKLTTLGAQNVKIWPKINFWFSHFNIFMPNCLKKTFKLKLDSCLTAVKFPDLIKFSKQPDFQHPWNESRFCAEIQQNYSQVCNTLSIHLALVLKTSHWYRFRPFYLSISPFMWHKCLRVFLGQLHLSKACWELWLSDGQPHSDYNGQWHRALCILAVLQSSQPNSQRNKRNGKCML